MYSETLTPRFSDTDALGHINNTMVPVWFEGARDPIFRLFTPELNLKQWPLILAKIDVSFHAQMFYGEDIEVRTYLARIGGASFDIYQEVWQNQQKCASGTAVMVNFCYQSQSSVKISPEIKNALQQHLIENDQNNT
jgi:acyl-CoA thioester hydrolase